MRHKISDIFNGILNPAYWLMNDSYNEDWDRKLNELLDKNEYTHIDQYEAKLGGHTVWVANHPYASFKYSAHGIYVRPSRATISRAYRKLKRQIGMPVNEYLIKKSLS